MSTALRMTITSMVMFMVMFLVIRLGFAVFGRDISMVDAVMSMETWLPVIIAGAFYGLIMYFINLRKYPEK